MVSSTQTLSMFQTIKRTTSKKKSCRVKQKYPIWNFFLLQLQEWFSLRIPETIGYEHELQSWKNVKFDFILWKPLNLEKLWESTLTPLQQCPSIPVHYRNPLPPCYRCSLPPHYGAPCHSLGLYAWLSLLCVQDIDHWIKNDWIWATLCPRLNVGVI